MARRKNIVMTGFMCTGKTTVGKLLAEEMGYEFVDTDELIMTRTGQSIAQIFEEKGEAAFRTIESDLAKELAGRDGLVISTGGRMMLDPENAEVLESSGRVFCLVATPEEIVERYERDKGIERPLLQVANPKERVIELLQQRQEGYGRFAQIATTEKTAEEVTKSLAGIVRSELDTRLPISARGVRYEYMVGEGLLPFVTQLAGVTGRVAVITDKNTGPLYARSCGHVDHVIEVAPGQQSKTLSTVQAICEELVEREFDRTATVVAIGGSVISGLAGFVAATYMRGIDLVQCPTSLASMIDSSIGGKAGINLPQGNNLIGIYKQPRAVIADIATLQTLPAREFTSGMAEVIKHALIADSADLLEDLENGSWGVEPGELPSSLADIQSLVARAIQVKINIIQKDPYEKEERLALNLGHTFAYAIEHASRHAFTHGEAVAIGLAAAANLSARMGYCGDDLGERVEALLARTGLPNRIDQNIDRAELYRALSNDKKRRAGKLRFVLLRDIGDVFVSDEVDNEALSATLDFIGA